MMEFFFVSGWQFHDNFTDNNLLDLAKNTGSTFVYL